MIVIKDLDNNHWIVSLVVGVQVYKIISCHYIVLTLDVQ